MSLINVSTLTFAYDGSYDNIFENVNFQIDTDWKLGFTGRNGRGKNTFLILLLGRYEYGGAISASVNFEYFPFKVTDSGDNTLDVIESIYPEYLHWRLLCELSLLQVSEDVLYRSFATLSNGEQTKIVLNFRKMKNSARILHIYSQQPRVPRLGRMKWKKQSLAPLTFIDVISCMQIEELLLEYSPTMRFIEHESEFCQNIATKLLEL